jgi:TetR/AcrR family transcriptional regulator, lmrAB and yxaGH operons repressor
VGARTDTRSRMVASAALLLREHGVAGTSFAKVLEHARGPRGSVGFHFPEGKTQLVAEAVSWAGGLVTRAIGKAAADGAPADRVFAMICDHYRRHLRDSDYAAGCPVGAVAQEAHADPGLRAAVDAVLADWRRELTASLVASGHPRRTARDLADLCIAAVEGAILMARIDRSTRPLDVVERRITPLLSARLAR